MNNAIELHDVCKEYAQFKLNKVSFTLPSGNIMGFIGENGAGKSTTIKAMLNLISIDGGSIKLLGMDYKQNELEIKKQIGVVLDNSNFHDNLHLNDISKIMGNIYDNWNQAKFTKLTNSFSLPSNKMVKDFSRGMKQKLSIAAALSHNAKLLILDEATSGLDPIMRDEILDIFMEFIQEEDHSVLISSHITSDLEKIADYITFINKGNIEFCQPKDELLDNYGIIHCTDSDYDNMNKSHVVGLRKSKFSYEVMINNRQALIHKSKQLTVDPASLEEIILFKIRGEQL